MAALAFSDKVPTGRVAPPYPIQTNVPLPAVAAEAVGQRVALGRQATVYAALMAARAVSTAEAEARASAVVVSAVTAEEALFASSGLAAHAARLHSHQLT